MSRLTLWILALPNLLLAYQKIPMFIGHDPDTGYGFEIRAFPDIIRDFTVISGHDFKCTERNKCILDGVKKVMTFLNKTIVYYDAATQLNLIKQPFSSPYNFRYLADDPENIGSWIGIADNSSFLNYLYQQDVASNYRIIVRLGWDNTLTYKMGVFEADKLLLQTSFKAIQTINNGGIVSQKSVTFCLNNRLDMATQGLSIVGIPVANSTLMQSLNDNWAAQANPDQSRYNITWSLTENSGYNIGNMTVNFTDMNVNGTNRIKFFTPEFDNSRNCDVYTGSLILKKYDFKYYYIEFNDGYEVRFSMIDFVVPPPVEQPVTWTKVLKIILIVLVVLVAALIVWKNVCHHGDHGLLHPNDPPQPLNIHPMDVPLLRGESQVQPTLPMGQSYPQTLNMNSSYPNPGMLLSNPPSNNNVPPTYNVPPAFSQEMR